MNMSISWRLAVMSAGAVVALIVVGLLGYTTSQQISADLKHTSENVIRSLGLLSDAERNFLLIRVNGLYHLSYDDPEKKLRTILQSSRRSTISTRIFPSMRNHRSPIRATNRYWKTTRTFSSPIWLL